MMETRSIEVELPAELTGSEDDLEVLRVTFQTIVTLARECGGDAETELHRMQDDGWTVHWGLTWIANAKRGNVSEEVTGSTKEDAILQLSQMSRLHEVEGCP